MSVFIDPTVGGTLTTADGQISIQVPIGASADSLTLILTAVDPALTEINLSIDGRYYTLFVLDSAGKVLKVFPSVKPEGHAAELIEFISTLRGKKPAKGVSTNTSTAKQVKGKIKAVVAKETPKKTRAKKLRTLK